MVSVTCCVSVVRGLVDDHLAGDHGLLAGHRLLAPHRDADGALLEGARQVRLGGRAVGHVPLLDVHLLPGPAPPGPSAARSPPSCGPAPRPARRGASRPPGAPRARAPAPRPRPRPPGRGPCRGGGPAAAPVGAGADLAGEVHPVALDALDGRELVPLALDGDRVGVRASMAPRVWPSPLWTCMPPRSCGVDRVGRTGIRHRMILPAAARRRGLPLVDASSRPRAALPEAGPHRAWCARRRLQRSPPPWGYRQRGSDHGGLVRVLRHARRTGRPGHGGLRGGVSNGGGGKRARGAGPRRAAARLQVTCAWDPATHALAQRAARAAGRSLSAYLAGAIRTQTEQDASREPTGPGSPPAPAAGQEPPRDDRPPGERRAGNSPAGHPARAWGWRDRQSRGSGTAGAERNRTTPDA